MDSCRRWPDRAYHVKQRRTLTRQAETARSCVIAVSGSGRQISLEAKTITRAHHAVPKKLLLCDGSIGCRTCFTLAFDAAVVTEPDWHCPRSATDRHPLRNQPLSKIAGDNGSIRLIGFSLMIMLCFVTRRSPLCRVDAPFCLSSREDLKPACNPFMGLVLVPLDWEVHLDDSRSPIGVWLDKGVVMRLQRVCSSELVGRSIGPPFALTMRHARRLLDVIDRVAGWP